MAVDGRAPRHAVTHFVLAEALARTSLLEVRLETGRTHQIRVHLAAIGHPVVGDRVYGRGGQELGLTRQFLHAARLAFEHPITGRRIELDSPLPPRPRGGARARARGVGKALLTGAPGIPRQDYPGGTTPGGLPPRGDDAGPSPSRSLRAWGRFPDVGLGPHWQPHARLHCASFRRSQMPT